MRGPSRKDVGKPSDRQRFCEVGITGRPVAWMVARLLLVGFFAFSDTTQAEANPETLARADRLVEARNLDGARQVLEAYLEKHTEVGPVWQRLRQIYVALARETLARSLDLPEASALNGPTPRVAENGSRAAPATPARPSISPPPPPAASAPQATAPVRAPEPVAVQVPLPAPSASPPPRSPQPVARPEVAPSVAQPDQTPVTQGTYRERAASAEIENLTRAWARAWSARDLGQYLGFYASGFVGSGARTRAEWEEARRLALERAQDLNIRIERMRTRPVSPTRVEVRFLQLYRSSSLSLDTWKTLVWEWEGSRWAIVGEIAGAERGR